jgi:hypothetical protein
MRRIGTYSGLIRAISSASPAEWQNSEGKGYYYAKNGWAVKNGASRNRIDSCIGVYFCDGENMKGERCYYGCFPEGKGVQPGAWWRKKMGSVEVDAEGESTGTCVFVG